MRTTIFTVDVERDWDKKSTTAIETVLPRLLDYFDDHKIRATFFVVGELVEQYEDELREMGRKHELASHSHTHINLKKINKEERLEEFRASRQALANIGVKCIGFRAPYNVIPETSVSELRSMQYVYDSSLSRSYFPGRFYSRNIPNRPYLTGIGSLKERGHHFLEIPVSSYSIFKLPFGLSFLRAFDPWYPLSKVGTISCFYLHLHEFMEGKPPKHAAPVVNWLSGRNTGKKAWQILSRMISYLEPKGISCKDYIKKVYPRLLE